jgi:hypothetical protein
LIAHCRLTAPAVTSEIIQLLEAKKVKLDLLMKENSIKA